ncbi:MAG: dTDP-4-dehydrorhamnose reductase [Phycisphaeraceae bacterium]|nr:dTDP-4-dehydrorhamnose reductase [Phycisphaeraceae bacterium]
MIPRLVNNGPRARQPVVLIGFTGMLGWSWHGLLEQADLLHGVRVDVPDRSSVDLANPESIRRLAVGGYRTYINCAAWTDVDGAEANEAAARRVNGEGVGALAKVCRDEGALLVHFSTDYVFDGDSDTPYPVDHPRSPINAYGRTKVVGEELIEASGCEYLLIRTSWLYATSGKNFVRTIVDLAKNKPCLRVVNDQRGRPTSCDHLASTALSLIAREARGTFHVTDGGECTWFEFATEIVRLAGLAHRCEVAPCTSAEYPRPARRPAYSVLDLSRAERLVGRMPDWKDNLADVMGRLA